MQKKKCFYCGAYLKVMYIRTGEKATFGASGDLKCEVCGMVFLAKIVERIDWSKVTTIS